MKRTNYKKRLHIIILYIIIVLSVTSNIILNKNILLENKTKTQILKSMDETTEVTNLNKSIETLNASHTEYANYIQESKTKIASAITDMGVNTSEEETFETMVNNIRNIAFNNNSDLTYVTSIATGTFPTQYCSTLSVTHNLNVIPKQIFALVAVTRTTDNLSDNVSAGFYDELTGLNKNVGTRRNTFYDNTFSNITETSFAIDFGGNYINYNAGKGYQCFYIIGY